jgi:hypothetical protein
MTVNKLPSLYNISTTFLDLLERLDTTDPNDEAAMQALSLEFTNSEAALTDKAESVAFARADLKAYAAMCLAEAQRLTDLAAHYENRVEKLDAYVIRVMDMLGRTKIEAPRAVLTVKANPERVEVLDEGLIPENFMHQPPQPPLPRKQADKNKIKAAAAEGVIVPGVRIVRTRKVVVK